MPHNEHDRGCSCDCHYSCLSAYLCSLDVAHNGIVHNLWQVEKLMRCSWVIVHDCHGTNGESGGDDGDEIACFKIKNCMNVCW